MMYEKDTVMRIIRRLGEAWARLMGLLDDAEARHLLDQEYRDLCGLRREDAESLGMDTLADLLPGDKLMALAELTYARAQRFAPRMDPDALYALRMRALLLFCRLRDPELAQLRLFRVLELLDLTQGPYEAEQAVEILGLLTRAGAYGKAEDLLFDQLATWRADEVPGQLLEAGHAFYAALRALTDADLDLGGLPRQELDEGEKSLTAYAIL